MTVLIAEVDDNILLTLNETGAVACVACRTPQEALAAVRRDFSSRWST